MSVYLTQSFESHIDIQGTRRCCQTCCTTSAVELVEDYTLQCTGRSSFSHPAVNRQLSNTSSESSSKYQRAEAGRLAAVAETDQVRRDLQARVTQAEQQAITAQAAVTRGQQEVQQLQQRLHEAENKARSAAANAASPPPPGARNCALYIAVTVVGLLSSMLSLPRRASSS